VNERYTVEIEQASELFAGAILASPHPRPPASPTGVRRFGVSEIPVRAMTSTPVRPAKINSGEGHGRNSVYLWSRAGELEGQRRFGYTIGPR
jgi:hypothetical protein